jgi:hypothetical protein
MPRAADDEKGSLTMAAQKRLLTEKTDPATTADMINSGLSASVWHANSRGPLADFTGQQVAHLASLVLYALGEVFEKQFYPNDREQCQEVAREIRQRAGLPVPPGVVLPHDKAV